MIVIFRQTRVSFANAAFEPEARGRQLMGAIQLPLARLGDEIRYLCVGRHAECLEIESFPRQRADDPEPLEQRSDPLYWDVRNQGHRTKVPGERTFTEVILQELDDRSKNNQNHHEISSSDITKWDRGRETGSEREHTSNCRSAVFGARGALHEHQ
jgi:hypothetical protein